MDDARPLPIPAPHDLGSFLQQYRLSYGLSVREFAALVHIDRRVITKLEAKTHDVTQTQLARLAVGMGVDLALLHAYVIAGGTNGHTPTPQKIAGCQRVIQHRARQIRQGR